MISLPGMIIAFVIGNEKHVDIGHWSDIVDVSSI
jgi:hypothetical protein